MPVKRAFADIAEGQVHYWHGEPRHIRYSDARWFICTQGPAQRAIRCRC